MYSFYEYSIFFKVRLNSQFDGLMVLLMKNLEKHANCLQIAMYLFDKFGKMAEIYAKRF